MRGAASLHLINKLISGFLLTRLMRGAAFFGDIYVENISTFLLTRLMRGAATGPKALNSLLIFLLTRLMRGAAASRSNSPTPKINFYSRASCEARQKRL